MNNSTKRSGFGLAAVVVAALAGCGGSGSDQLGERMGIFNLSVSDSPIDVAKVCIKFDGVHIKPTGEDRPIEINLDELMPRVTTRPSGISAGRSSRHRESRPTPS